MPWMRGEAGHAWWSLLAAVVLTALAALGTPRLADLHRRLALEEPAPGDNRRPRRLSAPRALRIGRPLLLLAIRLLLFWAALMRPWASCAPSRGGCAAS
jgi:hypothetical protein